MPNAITRLITWMRGEFVGEDEFGNRYYRDKTTPASGRRRRWVVYSGGDDEATRVPPMHHAWLHYTIQDFPDANRPRRAWEKPHLPNLTGTPEAYRPPGHTLRGGHRDRATGDYEAWTPE